MCIIIVKLQSAAAAAAAALAVQLLPWCQFTLAHSRFAFFPAPLPGTGVGHQPAREVGSGLGHHGPLGHPGQGQHNRALAAALPGSAQGRGKGSSGSETPSFAPFTHTHAHTHPGFLREPSSASSGSARPRRSASPTRQIHLGGGGPAASRLPPERLRG